MAGEKIVGTVVGVTNPREFYFAVAPGEVQLQDLVCVDMHTSETGREVEEPVRVWAKVVEIERINPLFPEEAAQEISTQRISAFDTVVSLSREMITAKCIVIGRETRQAGNIELRPLTYPLQPASSVYLGSPENVENLIIGNVPRYRRLKMGCLRGHPEFPAFVDAHAIVARHLAVLAATGAGKTVTVRKILEELTLNTQYPVLILDPHSDYLGLEELEELKGRVVVYSPAIYLADEDPENVIGLVRDLSGESLTAPQESLLRDIIHLVRDNWDEADGWTWEERTKQWVRGGKGWRDGKFIHKFICPHARRKYCLQLETHHFYCLQEVLDTIGTLKETSTGLWKQTEGTLKDLGYNHVLKQSASFGPVSRQLSNAAYAYKRIRDMNRKRLKEVAQVRPLPRPSAIHEVIQKGRIAIISLEGYTTCATAIVKNLMRQLIDLRLEDKIRQFLTVVEEAHNFVPSTAEQPAPSSEILRQIATEGRKYGMGLVLVSQRPSRVDPTVLSQCNSFVILRIINPADQKYVRDVVESLGAEDAKLLPDLATGEALVTGECVRFPMLVQVEAPRSRGRHEEEDFLKDFSDTDIK